MPPTVSRLSERYFFIVRATIFAQIVLISAAFLFSAALP